MGGIPLLSLVKFERGKTRAREDCGPTCGNLQIKNGFGVAPGILAQTRCGVCEPFRIIVTAVTNFDWWDPLVEYRAEPVGLGSPQTDPRTRSHGVPEPSEATIIQTL